MKRFAIGDGEKLIGCPDEYSASFESDDTMLLWRCDIREIFVRVTVLTINPNKVSETDEGFWSVIHSANDRKVTPVVLEEKSLFWSREVSGEEDTVTQICNVGLGNHVFVFSVAASTQDERRSDFERVREDVDGMIESIQIRSGDESFTASLLESDKDLIRDVVQNFLGETRIEDANAKVEDKFQEAKQQSDIAMASKIGFVFGEMIRNQIPGFQWAWTIDEYGKDRSLVLDGTTITLFPESSIVKRVESKDDITIAELMDGIIDAVEDMFRKHTSES